VLCCVFLSSSFPLSLPTTRTCLAIKLVRTRICHSPSPESKSSFQHPPTALTFTPTTMKLTLATTLGFATTALTAAVPHTKRGAAISVTPHDSFSSSVGVLGCKINTDRVAYWPTPVSCAGVCVRVDAKGRSVFLLKIDTSGGAHDISYDAYNYLVTGQGAAENPIMGGPIEATYEDVDMSECAGLLSNANGKLGFAAANSMNFISSCPAGTWVGDNYSLFNIANSACTLGHDEECHLDLAVSNQPACPHMLGEQSELTTAPVWNKVYGTGVSVKGQ